MKRQDLRNRYPFHNPRLATMLETTGRAAFLRRQLELRIIASVLAGVALGCLISAAILFCLESKP